MEQFRHSRGCFLCMRIFKDIYINLQYNINMTYVNLCGTTLHLIELRKWTKDQSENQCFQDGNVDLSFKRWLEFHYVTKQGGQFLKLGEFITFQLFLWGLPV